MLFITLLKKTGCFKSENTILLTNLEQNTLQMDYKGRSLLSAPYEEAQSYSGTRTPAQSSVIQGLSH